jgi:cysteine desulfurase
VDQETASVSERIYLDHAATTPLRADVLDAMLPYFSEHGYNPSSVHAEGRRARAAVDAARERIAAILHCKPKEIVFTAGGTEADNLAIAGIARNSRKRGSHIVSSTIEHHAVLHVLDAMHDEGFEITLVPVDSTGVVDVARFESALRADTILATIMYANNEIGTVEPIAQLATLARERSIPFVVDAVQAAGCLNLDVNVLGVDGLSLSAHKFYGPKGVGLLYAREGTPLEPIVHGGGQERGRRSGTENVAGVVGMAYALELAESERVATSARIARLRDELEARIAQTIPRVRVNAQDVARLPQISSMSLYGIDAESLVIALDLAGVAVSAGSACSAGAVESSHVIRALGLPPGGGTVRFSLGRSTTAAEIERVITIVAKLVASQREGATLSV